MQRTVLRFADILVAVMHWDCTVRGVQGNALSRIQAGSADWLDYTYWSVEGGGAGRGERGSPGTPKMCGDDC